MRFQIQISIHEFQIEFESVNPPTAAGFDEMKILTANKSSRILAGWIRQINEHAECPTTQFGGFFWQQSHREERFWRRSDLFVRRACFAEKRSH